MFWKQELKIRAIASENVWQGARGADAVRLGTHLRIISATGSPRRRAGGQAPLRWSLLARKVSFRVRIPKRFAVSGFKLQRFA